MNAGVSNVPDRSTLPVTEAEELDRACDQFEAAWRAGQSPRLEGHLEGVPAPSRAAWLAELLAVELDWRRRRGERPTAAEYLRRFPDRAAAVAVAFGADRSIAPSGHSTEVDAAPGFPAAGRDVERTATFR